MTRFFSALLPVVLLMCSAPLAAFAQDVPTFPAEDAAVQSATAEMAAEMPAVEPEPAPSPAAEQASEAVSEAMEPAPESPAESAPQVEGEAPVAEPTPIEEPAVTEEPAPAAQPAEAQPASAARFAVFMPEQIEQDWYWFYYTGESQHLVQTAIEKALVRAGLEVVDIASSEALTTGSINDILDPATAVQTAAKIGATHLVVGRGVANKASEGVAYNVTVIRANADVNAKLIRVSDGKVLAVEDVSVQAGGQAIRAAAKDALKQAGEKMGSRIARAAADAAATP